MVMLAGVLVIAGAMIVAAILAARRRPANEWASVAAAGVVAGAALVLLDRFSAPPVPAGPGGPDLAAITAAAERAAEETEKIEELRKKLEEAPPPRAAPVRTPLEADHASEEVTRKLREVDQTLSDAKAALASLREVTELSQLIAGARGDDRLAFDRLERLAKDQGYRYHDTAASVRRWVVQEHAREIVVDATHIAWRPGVDPRRVTASELRPVLDGLPAEHKPAFLDFVSQRRDLSRRQRMSFFADVIRKDHSLHVVECAGRYFAQEAGMEPRPLGVGFYLDWWASNEGSIRD